MHLRYLRSVEIVLSNWTDFVLKILMGSLVHMHNQKPQNFTDRGAVVKQHNICITSRAMTEANVSILVKSKPWPRCARPRRRRKRECEWWVQGRKAGTASCADLLFSALPAGKLQLQDVAMWEFKTPLFIQRKGWARRGFWLSANKLLWLWHMTSTAYFKFTTLLCSTDFQFNNTELLRR